MGLMFTILYPDKCFKLFRNNNAAAKERPSTLFTPRGHLLRRCSDVYALAVFVPIIELIVVYPAVFNGVVGYDRVGHEVLETNALPSSIP